MSVQIISQPRYRFAWLFGKNIDLSFFFLPALVAPLLFLLKTNLIVNAGLWSFVAAQTFGFGPFHIGATWFQYFDRENRAYYLSNGRRVMVFIIVPILLLIGTPLLAFVIPGLIFFIFMAWSVQHLVQQNVGILLLYHNHNQQEAIVERNLEIKSQHLAAILCAMVFFERVFMHLSLLSPISLITIGTLGAATLAASCRYLKSLSVQLSEGAYLNVPALLFWNLSMLAFLPFALLGQTYTDAILITNLVHFSQYIGLVYLLAKRKYQGNLLSNLPRPAPMYFFWLAGLILVMVNLIPGIYAELSTSNQVWFKTLAQGIIMGVGMTHYWQDAFMWRFREPFNRKAILQYLRIPVTPSEPIGYKAGA